MRKNIGVMLAILTLYFAGCAGAAETIRIGVYNCLSGPNATAGRMEVEGIQLAHKEMPEVLGKQVELVVADNKSDMAEAAVVVARLIEKDRVVAILGSYGSSLAMAGGGVAEQAGIPVVGASCTSPLVTAGKKYYFRVCFTDIWQGAGAARYAFRNLGWTRGVLLFDAAGDASVGVANFFKKSFVELGGTVLGEFKYQAGERDFREQLTAIAALNPEFVYMPSYFEEGSVILEQAREMGLTCEFFGSDSIDNPQIAALPQNAAEGFRFTTAAYDPAMPDMNARARHFTEAWSREHPDQGANAQPAQGYDSYFLLMEAIRKAGSTEPDAIRDALASIKNLPAVTGMITIDANHDAEKDLGIIKIIDGRRVFCGTISPGYQE